MIEIKGLSKSFGEKKILDNLNVSIAENSILTLVGPSGGGKTTLLRCLAGLETADSGEVWMNDSVLKFSEIAGDIGFVFQDFNLFPHFTVLENITLAPKMTKKKDKKQIDEEALKLLEKFGLKEQVNQYPSQLSGGQKQRVAIVRALIMSPKLLCYDEPTSALDPLLVDSIAETIMELKEEGMTQVVVTHDLSFAKKISDTLIEVNPV
jgi:polar amino acid transport system ATP-binding protein